MQKSLKRSMVKYLAIAIMLSMLICAIAINPIFATGEVDAVITTDRITDKNEILLDETITLNYSIQPQPISYEPPEQKDKEIVLVIDTSGSMCWNINGDDSGIMDKRRIIIAKNAALKFIENIESHDNVKVSLVSYANIGYVKNGLTANFGDVKEGIISLNTNGETNIGDGLRRAYYELNSGSSEAEKYIILLTDGEPTYHSYEYVKKKSVFFMGSGVPCDYKGGGTTATEDDINYCYKVVNDLIKTKNIMTYMVAFTDGSNKNILQELANAAGGEYKAAADSDALQKIYQNISNELVSDFTVSNVTFEEVFPEGIEIVSFSEGSDFTIEGQKATAALESICYNYNDVTKQYEAAPINFEVKLKGTVAGDYILGKDNSSKLTYKGVNGENCCEYFPEVQVSVLDPDAEPTPEPTPAPTCPALKIENITRTGEKIRVKLEVTLPYNAVQGQLRDINNVPYRDSYNQIIDINSSGSYYLDELSIYKSHDVKLWVRLDSGEIKETALIPIFKAIDIN